MYSILKPSHTFLGNFDELDFPTPPPQDKDLFAFSCGSVIIIAEKTFGCVSPGTFVLLSIRMLSSFQTWIQTLPSAL